MRQVQGAIGRDGPECEDETGEGQEYPHRTEIDPQDDEGEIKAEEKREGVAGEREDGMLRGAEMAGIACRKQQDDGQDVEEGECCGYDFSHDGTQWVWEIWDGDGVSHIILNARAHVRGAAPRQNRGEQWQRGRHVNGRRGMGRRGMGRR